MAEILMVDALNPPDPDQLVADMRSVGARAVAMYLLRRDATGKMMDTGTWTVQHVAAVQSSGRAVLPILVPGSAPGPNDMALAIQIASSAGIVKSAIAVDIEQFSFPAPQWLTDAVKLAHSAGWRVIRYGDVGPLGSYPVADGDWVSHGKITVTRNQIAPMPSLPSGVVADQYSVGCVVNGSEYDASVADTAIWGDVSPLALEGTQVAGRIVRAPFDPNRLDVVWVDPDGFYRVKTSAGGAGGLDSSTQADAVDKDHVPDGGFFDADAVWDKDNRLCYLGFANNSGVYLAVQRVDGVFDQNWSPLQGVFVRVPPTSAPIVKPAPDTQLRAALKNAVDAL